MKLKVVTAVVLSLTLLLAGTSAVLACNLGDPDSAKAQELGLSEAQQSQIADLTEEYRTELEKARENMRAARSDRDSDALEEAASARMEIREEMKNTVGEILTPEQAAEYENLCEPRWANEQKQNENREMKQWQKHESLEAKQQQKQNNEDRQQARASHS